MFKKIYPHDQIEKYLYLDIIFIVLLIYNVIQAETIINLFLKIVLLLLVLLFFYFELWYRDWRLLLSSLCSCILFALLAIFIESWLLFYGFVIGNLLGRAQSKLYIGIGTVGIAMMFFLVSWYTFGHPFSILKTSLLLAFILQLVQPFVIHIREKAKSLQKELSAANSQIERYIQEEERHRIARDLHDTLGQTLTMIKLKSELTIRLIEKDPPQAKQELNDILDTSRFALKQVRELVTDMKYISIESELNHLRELLHTAGIQFTINANGKAPLLSNVAETIVALSIREAITNLLRHSQANHCKIVQEMDTKWFQIKINDNGIGFQHESLGFGVQSIRERMKMIQGTVDIHTLRNNGTTIILRIPISTNLVKTN
ncbi:two-component sensor histidine kinase [Bacillus pseudomycoides]|uniref:sensor histidine kinase n=1 Tax=Bacillus pseudomycoides TaxID=64104 RepID=UPI000BF1B174|nr:sensor histidine kinase [Bacillus pseudomycoides]PEK36425.1 two-component sensor histidine kinase [Bacillus pseudomycoides]PEK61136.1 two-component sensor histidine kinase [Bacillus pseudomycoides]PEP39413.1 two-component sensor histidine kinase [Bacillus pseudomycoides]PEP45947.1 two-component sensor histidine kinase [Bacillus pseudomycoides]PFX55784.1 two-component sensor histidine kinase [Bacillus pseudomycoides]